MEILRSDRKNERLQQERNISFEQVEQAIKDWKIIDRIENKQHPWEMKMIIDIDWYACVVPYIENWKKITLKTVYKSRKQTKRYNLKK